MDPPRKLFSLADTACIQRQQPTNGQQTLGEKQEQHHYLLFFNRLGGTGDRLGAQLAPRCSNDRRPRWPLLRKTYHHVRIMGSLGPSSTSNGYPVNILTLFRWPLVTCLGLQTELEICFKINAFHFNLTAKKRTSFVSGPRFINGT